MRCPFNFARSLASCTNDPGGGGFSSAGENPVDAFSGSSVGSTETNAPKSLEGDATSLLDESGSSWMGVGMELVFMGAGDIGFVDRGKRWGCRSSANGSTAGELSVLFGRGINGEKDVGI